MTSNETLMEIFSRLFSKDLIKNLIMEVTIKLFVTLNFQRESGGNQTHIIRSAFNRIIHSAG